MNKNSKTSTIFFQDTSLNPSFNLDTSIIKRNINSLGIKESSNNEYNKIRNKVETTTNQIKDTARSTPLFLNIKICDKSMIASYKNNNWFESNEDSSCYIIKNQTYKHFSSIALLEKKDTANHCEKTYSLKEKPQTNSDWTIIPILTGMFLLASIVTIYRKYLGQLFESIIYRFASNKLFNDKNIHVQRLAIMLDVLFILSFSLIVDQIAKRFELYLPPEKIKYIIFLVSCAFLLILRFFRWFVFRLSGLFSNHQSFFSELYISSSLYTRILGVFLVPFVFLITYSTGFIASFFIYISLLSMLIVLIFRIVIMFKVFIVRGFSIFYFILYLCALEIIPLLVILKEVKAR